MVLKAIWKTIIQFQFSTPYIQLYIFLKPNIANGDNKCFTTIYPVVNYKIQLAKKRIRKSLILVQESFFATI